MKKTFIFVLLVLAACSSGPDFSEVSRQEAERDEYVEEVTGDYERLLEELEELNETVRMLRTDNDVKNERINNLEGELERLRDVLDIPPSPKGNLEREDLAVYPDRFTVNARNVFSAVFTATGSMEPVLDENAMAVQSSVVEPRVGDIVAFKSNFSDSVVVHRIIAVGSDRDGWFAITKGDNNRKVDPGKRRKGDIVGVTLSVLY